MESEFVKVTRQANVVTVTLDRPGTRNACTTDMWQAVRDAFRGITASGARAVVLTGANEDFCSGADVMGTGGEPFPGGTMAFMRVLAESVLAVHSCPVPVIVKVDGVAVGAGLGLALAGDLLYCSDRSRFSAIFAKLGLSLDYGTSWFLAQRIGLHKAKELAFTAEMMSAARAAEIGFVNAVHPAAELDDAIAAIVDRIASGPPIALSMTKRMLDNAASSSLAQALESEAMAQNVNVGTADMAEAFNAMREKRPPEFKGL
jgi:enoyl-CoA hydratase/carnithine racemase